jgi:predicted phage tail protein
MMPTSPPSRSLTDLFADMTSDIRTLFRQEVALVRAEVSEGAARAKRGVTLMVIGAAMLLIGAFITAIALVAILVAVGLSEWLATVLVAVVLLGGGVACLVAGKSAVAPGVMPTKSVDAIKDNAASLKGVH